MEKEIAALKSDVEHIKEDTGEIKQSISAFIAQSAKTSVELESLRGRVREVEHNIIALQSDAKNLKSGFAKLTVYAALAAGGATLTIDKIINLLK